VVQAVERAFSVLETFDTETPTLTAAEIAARTGLARPTTYRLLQTLQRLGYVRHVDNGYEVTHRVLRLGAGYLGQEGFPKRAQLVVDALTGQVGEHSAAAVLDEGEVVAVAAAHSPHSRYLSIAVRVGQRLPAPTTALGRIMLAHDSEEAIADSALSDRERDQIRESGYAVVNGLLESGLVSIGVPVRDCRGRVMAALSVAGNNGRVTVESLEQDVLPHLLVAAADLERLD
jgi:IclR family pca regulon transcriptional regulator